MIGSAHCVMDVTHGQTDRKFMDLPIPSPKHIIPNNPFYFFAFGKKVVDGKNAAINQSILIGKNCDLNLACQGSRKTVPKIKGKWLECNADKIHPT